MAINTSAAILRTLDAAAILGIIAEMKSETDHYVACAIRGVLRGGDTMKVVDAMEFEGGDPKWGRRNTAAPKFYGPPENRARMIRAYQNWEGVVALALAMEVDRERCGV